MNIRPDQQGTTMIKYFCDLCGDEISQETFPNGGRTGGRLETTAKGKNGTKLTVEILHSKDDRANAGIFCRYCIIDAINNLDDRPRAAERA